MKAEDTTLWMRVITCVGTRDWIDMTLKNSIEGRYSPDERGYINVQTIIPPTPLHIKPIEDEEAPDAQD